MTTHTKKTLRETIKGKLTAATRHATNARKRIGAGVESIVDIDELEDGLSQVESLMRILEPLTTARNPLALVRVVCGLGKFCIENPDPGDAEDYFRYEDRGWEVGFENALASIVFDSLRPKGELVRQARFAFSPARGPNTDPSPAAGAYVGTIDGHHGEVGWVINTIGVVETLFLPTATRTTDQEDILRLASEAFWARRKTKHLVLRMAKQNLLSEAETIGLVDDDGRSVHRSQLSDELVMRSRTFMEAGVNRTIMLYGPPGTGKSTAAQRLIVDLDVRSLRLPVETIHRLDIDNLNMIFKIVKPQAVVMDDFDRAREQDSLLERLEKMRKEVALVVATVNSLDSLDEALLRPGRFDELTEVDRLDDDAIRNILGDYADDSIDIVRSWPVAFIEEYIRRRQVMKMSAEAAKGSMVELAARVRRMRGKHVRGLSLDDGLDILTGTVTPESERIVTPTRHNDDADGFLDNLGLSDDELEDDDDEIWDEDEEPPMRKSRAKNR